MESRQEASLISTENELREAFAKLHDTWDFPRLSIEPTRVVLDFEEYDDAGRPQEYIELPTVYRLMPPEIWIPLGINYSFFPVFQRGRSLKKPWKLMLPLLHDRAHG